ncbi:MAG: NAD(P)-binding Rossmann-fold containing protein [Caulobacter sp.]|nr:NAD(P)-binding Rossmann-fold containing protein [Caulobacter sp.]
MAYNSPPPLDFTSHRLAGRVVLVTGATSGIGEAAVGLFAAEGASVVAAARRTDKLEAVIAALKAKGLEASAVTCDVQDEASVEAAVAFAVSRYGRLDGAFNNAGITRGRVTIDQAPVAHFDEVMATNLRGAFLCIKHEAAAMLAGGGGSIVNTSSVWGIKGAPGNAIYAASKWGLIGMTKCAALDYAQRGIRVNAIAPGPTHSEMFDGLPDEAAKEAIAAAYPMNYVAHPQDVARAALFLLSDESRWTTGAVIPCEGGHGAG